MIGDKGTASRVGAPSFGALAVVVFRIGVRLRRGAPPLPADLHWTQAAAAKASHVLLYVLLVAMPLVGWFMLSAGGYPIVLYGPIQLPQIMPHNDTLHPCAPPTPTWPTSFSRQSYCTWRRPCSMP